MSMWAEMPTLGWIDHGVHPSAAGTPHGARGRATVTSITLAKADRRSRRVFIAGPQICAAESRPTEQWASASGGESLTDRRQCLGAQRRHNWPKISIPFVNMQFGACIESATTCGYTVHAALNQLTSSLSAMALPAAWIAVDIIGTQLLGEVFVHSAAGERVARPLRRIAYKLGFDRAGEAVFAAVIDAALSGRTIPPTEGLVIETHQIDASDGTPVGLIAWVANATPTPRPTYNVWVLDMTVMTTRTSGDDPAMIGDGREAGEEKHVQHLFTFLNPEDAWSMVGGYYDALTGNDGLLIDSYWSLRPQEQWVHMWSSCRLRVTDDGTQRTLYGLTLKLDHREIFESNIASLVRYSQATLLLVEAKNKIPITTVGRLAPLGADRISQVLDQVDLNELAAPDSGEGIEQKIRVDEKAFTAAKFALHSAQEKHGDPVAIILLLEDQAA